MGNQASSIIGTSELKPLAYLLFALFLRFLVDFLIMYPRNRYWSKVVAIAINNGYGESEIMKWAKVVTVGNASDNLDAQLKKQGIIDSNTFTAVMQQLLLFMLTRQVTIFDLKQMLCNHINTVKGSADRSRVSDGQVLSKIDSIGMDVSRMSISRGTPGNVSAVTTQIPPTLIDRTSDVTTLNACLGPTETSCDAEDSRSTLYGRMMQSQVLDSRIRQANATSCTVHVPISTDVKAVFAMRMLFSDFLVTMLEHDVNESNFDYKASVDSSRGPDRSEVRRLVKFARGVQKDDKIVGTSIIEMAASLHTNCLLALKLREKK